MLSVHVVQCHVVILPVCAVAKIDDDDDDDGDDDDYDDAYDMAMTMMMLI